MIWICLSIIAATSLFIIFKVYGKQGENNHTIIVINYGIATILGCLVGGKQIQHFALSSKWLFPALTLGMFFFFMFYLIALTSQKASVSTASIANKISMIFPVSVAFLLYNEPISMVKIGGVIMALPAVYFSAGTSGSKKNSNSIFLLTVLLFIGSGFLDSYLKYIEHVYLPIAEDKLFVPVVFFTAFVVGLLYTVTVGKLVLNKKNMFWGVLLGIMNYFSIYFLLKALQTSNSSVVFPLNNVGVVALSVVTSLVFLKESLTKPKIFGFCLAIISMLMVYYG